MEISPGWVEAGATVSTVLLTLGGAWLHSAFTARDTEITALKGGQKNLFDKFDKVMQEVQAYKLHVAETYVNQAALQKMLDPIDRRLENIENDLRKPRPN